MACPFACHLFKPASQTHCSTQALLAQGSKGFCSLMWPPIMQQVVSYKASSRIPPSPLFPTRLEHPESGMQNVLLWHDVLCACVFHTSPPQRPTPPPKRSSPMGRKAFASARHATTHHAAGRQTQGFRTHTSITPLPYQPRPSKFWHAKSSAMACQIACLLVSHTSPPLRPTAPPNRSSPRGREASASASHAAMHHAAGRQTHQRLPRTNLHHPSSLPCSSIQSLACKVFCYGMSFCVPAFQTRHRLSHTLLHPSAPRPGVEWLLHQRVMWPPIMQQVVRYKASSRTPPSPLFPTRLEHPESGMQNIVL